MVKLNFLPPNAMTLPATEKLHMRSCDVSQGSDGLGVMTLQLLPDQPLAQEAQAMPAKLPAHTQAPVSVLHVPWLLQGVLAPPGHTCTQQPACRACYVCCGARLRG